MNGSTRRFEWFAAIAALSLLAIGVVIVLRPFFTALLWAMVLTFSTWPLYARLERSLGHRRWLSALLMTLMLALALVLPLAFLSTTIAEHATRALDLVRSLIEQGPPAPPSWIVNLPIVGDEIAKSWTELAADSNRFAEFIRPYLLLLRSWAIASGLAVGGGVIEISLSLVVAYFLYRDGAVLVVQAEILGRRVVGDRAQHLIGVASSTIRGVVYGILGTSLIQGILATLGYAIVGVPGALFLGFVTFFLAFLPSGPPLVWAPIAFWLVSRGDTGWAVFMVVWGIVVVGSIDHFLKPVLISRESSLPILLVFFGVVGGALGFGVIGAFLGPVLLAVAFSLLRDWTELIRANTPPRPAPWPPEREDRDSAA